MFLSIGPLTNLTVVAWLHTVGANGHGLFLGNTVEADISLLCAAEIINKYTRKTQKEENNELRQFKEKLPSLII
jgi:hypothetical protein